MAVRKRVWRTKSGEQQEAWVVDYVAYGKRHLKTFARKKDADSFSAQAVVDVAKGIHTPESRSLTVAEAADQWLTASELEKLERSTMEHYRTHVARHINPRIGHVKLAALTTPMVNEFRDALLKDLSRPLARKVLVSFRSIIKDGRRRGTIAHTVAEGVTRAADERAARKLEVGRGYAHARRGPPHHRNYARPLAGAHSGGGFFRTAPANCAACAGLMSISSKAPSTCASGPMHGHHRAAQDPHQRARHSGRAVRRQYAQGMEVGLSEDKRRLRLPGRPKPMTHDVMMNSGYWPVQRAAKVADIQGEPKYPGIHALRHFFASWYINRRCDGGLELPLKTVQQRMGHSTIVLTADLYSHLFPRGDDSEEPAAAERTLLTLR